MIRAKNYETASKIVKLCLEYSGPFFSGHDVVVLCMSCYSKEPSLEDKIQNSLRDVVVLCVVLQ